MSSHRRPQSLSSVPPPRVPGRPYRVCLVCMGNICRSPMAAAVVRAEVERAGIGSMVEVDSAGIGDWKVGQGIDPRARAALARNGYRSIGHRARQIEPSWLDERDLILVMDQHVLGVLHAMAAGRPGLAGRLRLMRSFDPASPEGAEIPDPYGGDERAFAVVLELIEPAARALAARLAETLGR